MLAGVAEPPAEPDADASAAEPAAEAGADAATAEVAEAPPPATLIKAVRAIQLVQKMGQLPDDRGPGQRFTLQANAFANGDQTWECTFTQTLGGTAAAPELATRPVAAAT